MQNLYRALFPRTGGHVVLGRTLQPFSNWHLLQLQFAKSPLVGLSPAFTLGDLAVAADICATSYPARSGRRLGFRETWRQRCAERRARLDIAPELRAWKHYRRDYCARPDMFVPTSAKMCQCPGPLAAWASLKLRGFGKAEAWNEPIGAATFYRVALAEAEGAEVRFMTDQAKAEMIQAGYGFLFEEAA